MSPAYSVRLNLATPSNGTARSSSFQELKQQWSQPNDVFSILLLMGGEIVNRALAQLSGGWLTPVTFSFGWVSYAISLLLSLAGDVTLMPTTPDGPCLVVHGSNGYTRNNNSWVIGRIVRDYDFWMDKAVHRRLNEMLEERYKYMRQTTKANARLPHPGRTGLCVSVYEPSKTEPAGVPKHDFVYWSGLAVSLVQIVISIIPVLISRNWCIFVITFCGTTLALATGSLSQWKNEKWNCRRASRSTYVITRGNGFQHAIVILGNGYGLNLEDLAVAGKDKFSLRSVWTRTILCMICSLWISLLITAAGLENDTWFLLAVGGIGMVQNVLVAGWQRHPGALGVHLVFKEVVGEMETMKALLAVENKYPNVGRSLLPIYFPGPLLPDEVASWDALKSRIAPPSQTRVQAQANKHVAPRNNWIAHAKTFEKSRG